MEVAPVWLRMPSVRPFVVFCEGFSAIRWVAIASFLALCWALVLAMPNSHVNSKDDHIGFQDTSPDFGRRVRLWDGEQVRRGWTRRNSKKCLGSRGDSERRVRSRRIPVRWHSTTPQQPGRRLRRLTFPAQRIAEMFSTPDETTVATNELPVLVHRSADPGGQFLKLFQKLFRMAMPNRLRHRSNRGLHRSRCKDMGSRKRCK